MIVREFLKIVVVCPITVTLLLGSFIYFKNKKQRLSDTELRFEIALVIVIRAQGLPPSGNTPKRVKEEMGVSERLMVYLAVGSLTQGFSSSCHVSIRRSARLKDPSG